MTDFTIHIKLDASPELLTTLDTVIECLRDMSAAPAQLTATASPVPAPAAVSASTNTHQMPSAPVTAVVAPPVTPVTTTAPQYTLADIQKACGPLMDAGKADDLTALMNSFGVESLIDIPENRYGDLATKLRELGARI